MLFYVTNCRVGGWVGGGGKLSFQCLRPFGPQTKIQNVHITFCILLLVKIQNGW
jgi:hypothetical protein